MGALLSNVTTAALRVLMFKGAMALVGEGTVARRRIPWAAVGLTVIALIGVLAQLSWSGAMAQFDNDASRCGRWRVVTSAFLQNGVLLGVFWNIVTLSPSPRSRSGSGAGR